MELGYLKQLPNSTLLLNDYTIGEFMKKLISILTAISIACFCVVGTIVQYSAVTSYKYGISISEENVKLGENETFVMSAKSNDGYSFVCYDVLPEGYCVNVSKKSISGNSGKVTFKGVSKADNSTKGDYYAFVSNKYNPTKETNYLQISDYAKKHSVTCKFDVYPAPKSVKLSTTNLTLGKGETFTISESTNSGSYANSQNLKWTTSNSNVAVVTKGSGNKATIIAKGVGTATITIKTYNGKTATCKVTVKNAPSSVKLSKTNLTLNKGTSYTVSETTNSGSYAKSFTWSSSNYKVVTVTKGSGNKATVKAVGKGTAYIKVKTYNGKTAQCKVTVK